MLLALRPQLEHSNAVFPVLHDCILHFNWFIV